MSTHAVSTDDKYMRRALALAAEASATGEVPVGAVLLRDGSVVAEGSNAQIVSNDPSAHAEIQALRAAGRREGNYRFPGTVLYVTLEPCSMCCGALIHARVEELVIAAREPRAGAVISARNLLDEEGLNHRVRWRELPEYAEPSGDLLRAFFRQRR